MIASWLVCAILPFASAFENNVLAGAPVNNITVSAGNITQCSVANITWVNAVPPVKLQIGTGGYYVGTTWLSELNTTASYSNWTVTQPANTSLIFQVTDSKGAVAYQQNIQVGPSVDATCLNSTTTNSTTVTSA